MRRLQAPRRGAVAAPAVRRGRIAARAPVRRLRPCAAFPVGPSTGDGDTIAALATPPARGAVAVVRVSGPDALAVAAAVFRQARTKNKGVEWAAESHTVAYGHAVDAAGSPIDEVLALAFRAPRSYTREHVVELHAHGGAVCGPRVLGALLAAGARLARPGEFTLRAYLSGRLGLDQAESVAALVSARSRGAADAALAGLGGGVGARVASIRAAAVDLVARVEASLDFDEGDVPDMTGADAVAVLTPLLAAVDAALSTAARGAALAASPSVALVGRPNVGKSSLLNALADEDRCIVSAEAGTTRDVVEVGVDLGGARVALLDTAGVRPAPTAVEAAGVARAGAAAAGADAVAFVVDGGEGWTLADAAALAELAAAWAAAGLARPPPAVLIVNKVDAVEAGAVLAPPPAGPAPGAVWAATVPVSARTGAGLAALATALAAAVGADAVPVGGGAVAVNARQADALTRARAGLARAADDASSGAPSDLWCAGVRDAAVALGEVTGADAREEVLDAVFSKFCIGK